MSIYRRTERFAPTDARVDEEVRVWGTPTVSGVPGMPAAPQEDWTRRRKTEPANGLLKPTFAWASSLPGPSRA